VPPTIEWIPGREDALVPGRVRLIDQQRLPGELCYLETEDVRELWEAIRVLKVRGAPAIGIAAAMAVVVAVQRADAATAQDLLAAVDEAAEYLATARPTAVNLFWALERMRRVAGEQGDRSPAEIKERLAQEAVAICEEDAAMCRAIGEHGVTLLKDGRAVLTHCNAGGLATARFGTALAPIYVAHERGMSIPVYSDETRPLLQGSRLTAWELQRAGVNVTVLCDNMAAQVMKEGRIQAVLVGSDRIAANGDVANKIGTYGLAVLAEAHGIPFYVLAPSSTFDLSLASGEEIPIEMRAPEEVTEGLGPRTAPPGVAVYSPAFDVTPARLVTAIVCESGIARPPYDRSLRELRGQA
jgi:methylthioribose-1-phosphate isomerase